MTAAYYSRGIVMTKTWERLVIFLLKRIALITAIFIMLMFAYTTGYNLSNIYVVVNEALDRQVEAVLDKSSDDELDKYFTANYIENEFSQLKKQYESIEIASYKHYLKVNLNIPNPLTKETYVKVQDMVTNITLVKHQDSGDTSKTVVPKWDNSEKLLRLVFVDGRWKIDGVVK